MYIVNLSKPEKYYRQNNNELSPMIRCKPTSTVECLDLAGWEPEQIITGNYRQPEDNLTDYIEKTYGKDAPEDWTAIIKAVRHFYGQTVCKFHNEKILKDMLRIVEKGNPCAISTRLSQGGHVVSLVGFEANTSIDDVHTVIIDDPYGNKTSGLYDTGSSGFNNKYKYKIFEALFKGYGLEVFKK
jgi:hypothetical protein